LCSFNSRHSCVPVISPRQLRRSEQSFPYDLLGRPRIRGEMAHAQRQQPLGMFGARSELRR
jgi:hypothetical protein